MTSNNLNELPEIWKKRLEYVDDITDEEKLNNLALYGENRFIQIKAIGNVKDKEILEELALSAEDWEVRYEALKYIDNQSIFEKLALNDRRWEVRQLAASHINDEEVLKEIAVNDLDREVSMAALGKIKSYSNQIYVLRHCGHPDVCIKIAYNVAYNVYDTDLLEDLVLNHHSHKVREIACKEITNTHVLKKVVCFEKYHEIKMIAFEKIDDPEALLYIAENVKSPHIAHAAILKIPYENIIVDYILEGKIFLDISFSTILRKIKQKSNLKRIICKSNNILLCKYLINNIDDENLLKQTLLCNIDEKLVLEIENRIQILKDKI